MKNNTKSIAGPAAFVAALLALTACGGATSEASRSSLTFVSEGGAYQAAQSKAMVLPFTKATGTQVVEDQMDGLAKIKSMVESGNVTWDVVSVDPYMAIGNCGTLAEKLDFSVIDTSKMPKGLVSPCAVPAMTYSFVLMYNKDKYGAHPPTNWADFYDAKNFPGTRVLGNFAQGGGYESALLADGVPANKLYPLDYDRAAKKMNSIRSDLKFYDTGAQQQQMMEGGQADMILAWSGRAYSAVKNGAPYAPVWNQNISVYNAFMVPKGSKNTAEAMKFIAYATGPDAQARLTENIPYSPINSDAKPQVDPLLESYLTTKPEIANVSVSMNQQWWADNQDEATKRWTSWTQGS
ncbi:polyamine ABC transporter substrate-binding protein [Arthrobacter sp. 2MCAF15]|uniref:ABC transporter substrate-binding protein n=1 Tax=Arthrobacter sp. 2MCAF15 TaxID=3232984 RepID=UPI003F93A1E2